MKYCNILSVLILALCCVAMTSCGKSDGLMQISGTVSLDGTPIQAGQIDFAPKSGSSGISAGGKIVDGKYTVRIKPGTMAVSVSSPQKTKKENPTPEEVERGIDDVVQETIPEKYNRRSELTQEITEGQKVYDFNLTSE